MKINRKIFICLAVVLLISLFVIFLNTRSVEITDNDSRSSDHTYGYLNSPESEEEILADYWRETEGLLEWAEGILSQADINAAEAAEIKNVVLNLRVPEERRDFHLRLYQLVSEIEECAGLDDSRCRQEAEHRLAGLIASLNKADELPLFDGE